MENKKVVVTGGAGFLGSHVAKLLIKNKYFVVVLDDFSNGKMAHLETIKNHPNLSIIPGDITNKNDVEKAFKGCHVVIHLAVLGLRQSIKEPQRVSDVIIDGTLNCLDVSLLNNIEMFLNCSSSEVYGTARYVPINEVHPLNPETPYAAAKVAQDMYVYSYGQTYDLPWITVRPFNMYGPNSHWQGSRGELIPKMIVRAMSQNPLIIFGSGTQTRDFIYVEDAAQALLLVLENSQCRNQYINICCGAEISVEQIAKLICKLFNLDPNDFIKKQTKRPGDVKRHLGDNSKIRDLIGFNPTVSFEEGLKRTIDWFKSLPFKSEELFAQEILRGWE